MPSRRKSREYAMQMLYQWELGGNTPEQVGASFFLERKADSEVENFARGLFRGTVSDIDRLDQLVREHAANWRLERMAAVDRSILRLAVYELLHNPETPPLAVINEALEIARRFSGEGSVEFVNGILDAILKALPARETNS
jgi:transcription antitermination protein NusB